VRLVNTVRIQTFWACAAVALLAGTFAMGGEFLAGAVCGLVIAAAVWLGP
jgi:hypothetical protein